MLLELKVRQFATIDSLEVRFLRPGLNVLTGETGAGKTVLIKSLVLLLGGKATTDIIRAGCDQASVEGAFDLSHREDILQELSDLSLDSGDSSLVVRRIISRNGKHRIYINGNLATLNTLEKLVPDLIQITSQNEHHTLLKPQSQLDLLDSFAGLQDLRSSYHESLAAFKSLQNDIEKLTAASRDREQKLDFLRFQVGEIEAFSPKAEEDTLLPQKSLRIKMAQNILIFAQKAESLLLGEDQSLHASLQELSQEGQNILKYESRFQEPLENLKQASLLIEEASYGFRGILKGGVQDYEDLGELEARLSDLKKLQKKYGSTVEEILSFRDKAQSEILELEKYEDSLKTLTEESERVRKEVEKKSQTLHDERVKAAKTLGQSINKEIKDLNMKGSELSIQLKMLDEFTASGCDEVSFMMRSSPQDIAKPLNKIASGGELSRIMLAIKQIGASSDRKLTYLFDEVDTGISGPTAEKVGRKLKRIGAFHQVICITHLPQVAAFADAHYLITKEVSNGQVKSRVTELSAKERVQEIGRLLSGEKITPTSLSNAREMIRESSANP